MALEVYKRSDGNFVIAQLETGAIQSVHSTVAEAFNKLQSRAAEAREEAAKANRVADDLERQARDLVAFHHPKGRLNNA